MSFLIILLSIAHVQAQHVTGMVYEYDEKTKKEIPLPDANVVFKGTTIGTTTDDMGMFSLKKPDSTAHWLVISYVGFPNDTVPAEGENVNGMGLKIVLNKSIMLDGVEVEGKNPDTYISTLSTQKTESITGAELKNLACCNLSESFESNPTVDVSFTDAVTGARQIQMLGLSGKYVQTLTDVLPTIRGLNISNGFSNLPGPWIESISLNKGAGSVANGYESITGQIDVELKKPEASQKLYVNLYGDSEQRFEGNLYGAQKLTDKWSTMTLVHGDIFQNKMDDNHDGFLDQPLTKSIDVMNRWKLETGKRIEAMFGARVLYDEKQGGQVNYNPATEYYSDSIYGIELKTNRAEVFWKSSLNFPYKPFQSLGIQISGITNYANNKFGIQRNLEEQSTAYANLVFLSEFNNTKNKFKTGISFMYDYTLEAKSDIGISDESFDFLREQTVPGAYFEYTYDDLNHLTVVAGMRGDLYKPLERVGWRADVVEPPVAVIPSAQFFWSPRLHIKYKLTGNSILRVSGGKGYHVANIFSENQAYLASSREWVIADTLKPEEAWNYGINFTQNFSFGSREGTFSFDTYRTDFIRQVVVDVYSDPSKVIFSNLDGKSFSNSLQAQISYEWFKNFSTTIAFKYNDVQQTVNGTLQPMPFVPITRGLVTGSYQTNDKHWEINSTLQYLGEQNLPSTISNPEIYQMPSKSPTYFRLLGQVSYSIKSWQFYAGSENITNYVQQDRIIAPDDPFGQYFDTSIVWGPLTGRMIYGGLRFSVK